MSNQSEEGSILCTPIGAKLWPSTSSRPTISTSANTTWRTAGTVWSVQNLRQLSLHGTNITPIQNSKARFMYKLYRHKLYRHNLYWHKLYRHKLYREQTVSGTYCIGNKLYREQIVSGTNCNGSLSFFYPFILFLMHMIPNQKIPNHKKFLIVNNRH